MSRGFRLARKLGQRTSWLTLEAVVSLSLARVFVRNMPASACMELIQRTARSSPRIALQEMDAVRRVSCAVERASARVPSASCLARAISGWVMLARRGIPSQIRLGILRDPKPGDLAHAWLEYRGECIVGSTQTSPVIPFSNVP